MILTNKQEQGLKIAIQRFKAKEPYTCISGFAGVGKTTLIRFIIEALELDPATEVAYVAFTGKAASVLRQAGCPNATTAHKLLYHARQMPNGKYFFVPKTSLENEYKLIVVDEISMLPKDMWELLLKHKVHIIASGDPFQLPPINTESDNHVLDKPHIFLDEIMRQAKESDIICLSMDIRERKMILPKKGNDVHIVYPHEVVSGMYSWADQILVATNKQRHEINNFMRQSENRGPEPEAGDKVICLKNNWEILSNQKNALVNGTIGYLIDPDVQMATYPLAFNFENVDVMCAAIQIDDEETFMPVVMDYKALTTGQKTFDGKTEYLINRSRNPDMPPAPIEFNYGYAITTHRAQGSQWGNVMVVEEKFPFDKTEHARWLYTAVTRAQNKLVLVLNR